MLADTARKWQEEWDRIKEEKAREGLAEGLAEGLEQGLAQGLEQGRAHGLRVSLIKCLNARFHGEQDWKSQLGEEDGAAVLSEAIDVALSAQSGEAFLSWLAERRAKA